MYSRISTGNLKAYHISILPEKVISEDSFLSLGVEGGGGGLPYRRRMRSCPSQLQVYDDYYVMTAKCAI